MLQYNKLYCCRPCMRAFGASQLRKVEVTHTHMLLNFLFLDLYKITKKKNINDCSSSGG